MRTGQQNRFNRQRGISLSGLVGALAVIGVVAVFAMKLVPAYAEFSAAKEAIAKAKAAGGSVAEMKSIFSKNADINSISAVTSRDLVFSRDGGDTEISFAYEKRIPLAGNVSLLIDYAATTDKSGVVAAQNASAQ